MKLNLGFFHFYIWGPEGEPTDVFHGKGCWFRLFGYGFHFTNAPLSFSERNGYEKVRKLPFGYRWKFLHRKDMEKYRGYYEASKNDDGNKSESDQKPL